MKNHPIVEVSQSDTAKRRRFANISIPEDGDVNEVLLDRVLKNIETIASHQDRQKQGVRKDRRILNKIAGFFARPGFLYFQIGFFAVWIGCTNLAERNIIAKNFPQFDLNYHGLEVVSLLISTEVLIAQAHQEKMDEERSYLTLQLNLVTEQKIAKLISLVEELRIDLPNVKNRNDEEADAMKLSIDPQSILEAIQQNTHPATDRSPANIHPKISEPSPNSPTAARPNET